MGYRTDKPPVSVPLQLFVESTPPRPEQHRGKLAGPALETGFGPSRFTNDSTRNTSHNVSNCVDNTFATNVCRQRGSTIHQIQQRSLETGVGPSRTKTLEKCSTC